MHSASLLAGIFKDTWTTIKLHWRKLIVIVLLLWVGGRAITYGISHYFSELPIEFTDSTINIDPTIFEGKSGQEIRQTFQPFILSVSLVSIIALVVLMLVQIAVTKLALTTKEDAPISSQALLPFTWKKIRPYIGTSFVQSIYLFFLFLLFIIPGLIYAIYRLFTTTELVASDLTYKKAMDESKRLVKGRRWITLLYLFLIVFGVAIIQIIITELIAFIPDADVMQALMTLVGRCAEVVIILLITHFYLAWRKTVVVTPAQTE